MGTFHLHSNSKAVHVNRSNWEGGLLETLTLDLGKPLQAKPDREKQVSLLAQYFRCKRRREHVTYTAKMMLCELLNLANVLGQLYLMDLFLGGHFATYGSDVFALTEQVKREQSFAAAALLHFVQFKDARVRVDAMSRLFPKMTKCIFRKFGPSGTVEAIDALCVMPLNNANEKIYVFLWFWFVLLAVLSVAHLVLRVVVAVGLGRARALLLWTMMRLVKFNVVEDICKEHSFGDWLVLYQLAKNLDPLVCRELAAKLRSPNSVSANGIESGRRQDQSKGVVEDTAF